MAGQVIDKVRYIQRMIYIVIFLVLIVAACSRVNIAPTSEISPVTKVLTENPCDNISMEQPEKPAFKGMEMYSWQAPEHGEWVFSILYGTNRNKLVGEIIAFEMDLTEIGKCFCNMPESESIFWLTYTLENTTGQRYVFQLPPDDVVDEVEKKAILCKVKLFTDSVRNASGNGQTP